jgi:DNA repair exonuclease SbcCD ATPase subunit
MTDPSQVPETAAATEITSFLRRFAGLMANGYNAKYLHHAADLLETLTADVTAASDEENLWRYKYETVNAHTDALEAECEALKNDIEGHLSITTAILSERDNLRSTLQARETALAELEASLDRDRGEFANKAQAHEQELDQLRAAVSAGERKLAELGLSFERERADLQAQRKVHEDEIEALRVVYGREGDELRAKIVSLEAKRVELRAAFDRISELHNQKAGSNGGADRAVSERSGQSARPGGVAAGETDAVVSKDTLRQARDQFEYLARECIRRGDIASQVMCELGAHSLDLALGAGREAVESPVGAVALNILAPPKHANGRD